MSSLFGGSKKAKKKAKAAAAKAEEKAAIEAKAEADRFQAEADRAKEMEAARQGRITRGVGVVNERFAPFDDPYYEGLEGTFRAAGRQPIQDAFDKSKKDLVFALGRRGTLDSSIATEGASDLAMQKAKNEASVAGQAVDYANQQRQAVEAQKKALIDTAYATADPQNVETRAIEQVQALEPKSVSPLIAAFDAGIGNVKETVGPYGLVDWKRLASTDPAKTKEAQKIIT